METRSKFNKGDQVNYYGETATITNVSDSENYSGWFTYSLKYYPTNEYGERMRHGSYEVEEHELKSL